MKDLITYIVKKLVDRPDEIVVTAVKGKHVTIYEFRIGKGDMGKLLGRRDEIFLLLEPY
jgi:predicted RNA-binding protein YlqC (UPF0109 family)